MLRNDQIQAALVAYLKANTTITAEVSADEIREDQWQGRDFTYPNIRVRLISNTPLYSGDCNLHRITLGIQVFTEDASSLNCDKIAGIINSILHDHHFNTSNITFSLRTTNLVPALRSNIQEWRSEVLLNGIVSG
jgi:hypothetical protein